MSERDLLGNRPLSGRLRFRAGQQDEERGDDDVQADVEDPARQTGPEIAPAAPDRLADSPHGAFIGERTRRVQKRKGGAFAPPFNSCGREISRRWQRTA